MSRTAFPFLRLKSATVDASPWLVAKGGGDFEEAGEYLPDWDYATDLHIRRTVRVHRPAAAEDLEIEERDLALVVLTRTGTGNGRLPQLILQQEQQVLTDTVRIEITIPGCVLSSLLHLDTCILLGSQPEKCGKLSPERPGDRLWCDSSLIRLEGQEPRFPIEIADFNELLRNTAAGEAPWYLHWSPHDWYRDFHGALRLYLDAGHEVVISRIEEEDPETLRFLMSDVMGQVCASLLMDEEAEDIITRCEDGTLGSQAMEWLHLAFPDCNLKRMKETLIERPGIFRAAFLAVAELKDADL